MPDQLHRVDLNLLVALQALIEEQNVTRAAERLFITQPAMSKTLQRLRDLFDDPLFTRSSHGLIPTPKTEELRAPLADVLDRLNMIVTPADFIPESVAGESGYADDLAIGAHVVGGIIENSGEGVVRRHWTGDADVIAATAAIQNDAPAMLGDVLWGKLKALVE